MKQLLIILTFILSYSLYSQQPFYCKVRLPDIVNSYSRTLLPVLAPDGSRLYFDRKDHPMNIGSTNDPDDIWYCDRLDNGYWSEPKNIGSPLNTESSNALFAIAPDGKSAFVASIIQKNTMAFYIARIQNGLWKMGAPINIANFYSNSMNYFATMNADQNVILFSISREETLGELDLYASFLQKDSSWTEPLWLGPEINTVYREGSPYLANDGKTLYFFSNGFGGFGGNDLFVSRRLDNSWTHWSKPVNLGPFINTSGNERSITLTAKGDTACIISTDSIHETEGIYFVCLQPELRPEIAQKTITPFANNEVKSSNIELELFFESGKWNITREMESTLSELCGLVKDNSRHAIIRGYTDNIGSQQYNSILSTRRAKSISQYLRKCGLESMDVIGEGINTNLVPLDSPIEQRKKSRKVTILLTIQM